MVGEQGEIAGRMVFDPVGQVDRVHAVNADQQDVFIITANGRILVVVGAGRLSAGAEQRRGPAGGCQQAIVERTHDE